jgi:hypothetical protein
MIVAGRQSPPPEEQAPKQGTEPQASGKKGEPISAHDKATSNEQDASKKTLEDLPSNPERKARV